VSDDEVGPLLPGAAAGFRRRSIRLEPGESRRSGDAEWRDALVVVEQGDVELECAAGGRRRFAGGAVLWLEGIDLRVLSRCTHVAGLSADAETDGSERLGTSLVTRRAHRHQKSITDRDDRPDHPPRTRPPAQLVLSAPVATQFKRC